MAYLTVRLSAGEYNPSTNSTSVRATVSITWDTSESYNQENGYGILTIGSYSTRFGTNFNASRTESGTQVLGGGSTTIKHNSNGDPIQVVASASGAGRSASDMITLSGGTPSGTDGDYDGDSDSGGGNSGSGGDSEGEGESEGDYEPDLSMSTLTMKIFQGEHTTVRAILVDGCDNTATPGQILKDGDILEYIPYYGENPVIQILYEVDNGYVINEHTVNGESFEYGYEWECNSSVCTIKTSAVEANIPYIYIDDGLNFSKYICYIDSGTSWDAYVPYVSIGNQWIVCGSAPTPSVKYLYKDGIMHPPLSDGFSTSGCSVSNSNNKLRYSINYSSRDEKTNSIANTAINLSDFKYLCVKVGEMTSYFFVGLNNGNSNVALNHAMRLRTKGSYYVDLTSVDLFGDYYLGFGTEEVGQNAVFYIEEMWLSNEIDDSLSYTTFDYILERQGLSG